MLRSTADRRVSGFPAGNHEAGENVTDQSKDRIEGKVDELTGRGKSAYGELTGDEQAKAEGDADQAGGKLQQGMADAKDKADDFVKKSTGSDG